MNDPRCGFRINGVKYESSRKALVSRAGIQTSLSVLDGGALGKELAECLLGRWHWSHGWSGGKLKFPVIIKKEWQENSVMDQSCGSYHYHAVATNKDLTNRSYQSIIEDYRSRAEVENQIKEFKHNFDAKHLPCLKKSANKIFFLIILISQGLVR